MAKTMTKAAGALLGSTVLAAMPAASEGLTLDQDPANDTFSGQPALAADVIQGTLTEGSGGPTPQVPPDLTDFYQYSLTPGSFFDFFVELLQPGVNTVLAEALSSTQTPLDSEVLQPNTSGHLTGTVPGNGTVVLGLTLQDPQSAGGAEEYRVTLSTRSAVPLPASVVLVAAGLVGLGGVHVARRRRAA